MIFYTAATKDEKKNNQTQAKNMYSLGIDASEKHETGQFVIGQFNKPITFKVVG